MTAEPEEKRQVQRSMCCAPLKRSINRSRRFDKSSLGIASRSMRKQRDRPCGLSSSRCVSRRAWLWIVHAVGGPVRAASAVGRPQAGRTSRPAVVLPHTKKQNQKKRRAKPRGRALNYKPYACCLFVEGQPNPSGSSFSSGSAKKRAKPRGGALNYKPYACSCS